MTEANDGLGKREPGKIFLRAFSSQFLILLASRPITVVTTRQRTRTRGDMIHHNITYGDGRNGVGLLACRSLSRYSIGTLESHHGLRALLTLSTLSDCMLILQSSP